MSPIALIALVICVLFVRKLMKIDRECTPNLSKAFWIPSIWYLYCATRPLADWFQTGVRIEGADAGNAIENGSFLDRNFVMGMIVTGVIILIKRRVRWGQLMKDNLSLVMLLAFMFISISWSDFMFVSFKRWIRVAGVLIMALVVLTEASPYEAMHAILRRVSYIVIPFSVLLVKYFPVWGINYGRWSGAPMFAGATLTKNTLGEVCLLWLFLFIWTYIRRKDGLEPPPVKGQNKCEFVMMLLTFYLMKGPSDFGAQAASYSATSILVLVVGLVVFFGLRRLRAHAPKLGTIICVIGVGAGGIQLLLSAMDLTAIDIVAPLIGRQADLTGRTDLIWPILLPIAKEHMMLGLGFGAFWIKPVPGLTLDINEAHNGYLDVYIELGIVGLILLAWVVVAYFRRAKNELAYDFNWGALRLAYLTMFLLHNWTETTVLRSNEYLFNLLVLFFAVHPDIESLPDSHAMVDETAADLESEYIGTSPLGAKGSPV